MPLCSQEQNFCFHLTYKVYLSSNHPQNRYSTLERCKLKRIVNRSPKHHETMLLTWSLQKVYKVNVDMKFNMLGRDLNLEFPTFTFTQFKHLPGQKHKINQSIISYMWPFQINFHIITTYPSKHISTYIEQNASTMCL